MTGWGGVPFVLHFWGGHSTLPPVVHQIVEGDDRGSGVCDGEGVPDAVHTEVDGQYQNERD